MKEEGENGDSNGADDDADIAAADNDGTSMNVICGENYHLRHFLWLNLP